MNDEGRSEHVISDLFKEIKQLKEELEEANKNVKDFMQLAFTWQKAYNDEVPRLKARITNLEQTIEDLREEIRDILSD